MKTKKTLFILFTICVSTLFAQQDKVENLEAFKYKFEDNKLLIEKTYFSLGTSYNTEVKTESAAIFNDTDEPMKITFVGAPEFITMKVSPEVLPAKSKGSISLEYKVAENKDNTGKQNWGFQNHRVRLIVNGNTQNSRNNLSIRADIQEDYRSLSPEELAKAPKIEFETLEYNFGKINQNDKVEHIFNFKNIGERDLEIRKIKSSCGCTAATTSTDPIAHNSSSSINVVFNSHGKSGRQSKTVTITTNDPTQPTVVVKMIGEVIVPDKVDEKSLAPTNNTMAPKSGH